MEAKWNGGVSITNLWAMSTMWNLQLNKLYNFKISFFLSFSLSSRSSRFSISRINVYIFVFTPFFLSFRCMHLFADKRARTQSIAHYVKSLNTFLSVSLGLASFQLEIWMYVYVEMLSSRYINTYFITFRVKSIEILRGFSGCCYRFGYSPIYFALFLSLSLFRDNESLCALHNDGLYFFHLFSIIFVNLYFFCLSSNAV